jgi:hypothetical protein
MPKSKNKRTNRKKKYDPNKVSKKKMNVEEESYIYTIPYFVKRCGQLLLACIGAYAVFVGIGLIIN